MASEEEFLYNRELMHQMAGAPAFGMDLAKSQVLHILENIVDAFVTLDGQGRITYINQAALELAHRTQAELVGQFLWQDGLTPFSNLLQESELRRALAEQTVLELDGYNPSLSIWLKVLAYPSPSGLFIHLQDISTTKRTQFLHEQNEIRLQEHQHLLQQVTDTLPGILYVYDLQEHRNVYVNQQVADILGFTPEQIQAMGDQLFLQIIHPEDLAKLPAHVQRFCTLQPGEVLENEYRMRNAQGEWRWFSGRDTVFATTASGLPKQVLGTAYDITKRKQAEESLRWEKERFELAASAVDCLIYDWCLETDQVERSNGLTRIFGYSPEETEPTSQWWAERIHPEDAPVVQEQIISPLASQNRYALEYRVRDRNQQYVYVLDQGRIVRDASGKAVRVVGTTTNISDRKITEKLQQFLLELNDIIRSLTDPDSIKQTVVSQVQQYFDVSCCSYGVLDQDQALLTIEAAACHQGPSVVGAYPLQNFGPDLLTALKHGRTIVMDDLQQDARTEAHQAFFARLATRALICVPLMHQEQLVALLLLHHRQPRSWSAEEIVLLEEVADRTHLEIEKTQAEIDRSLLLERSQQYANQLRGLTQAALVMNSVLSVDQALQAITEQAYAIVGAHLAVTSLLEGQNWSQATHTMYLSPKYAAWSNIRSNSDGFGIYAYVCQINQPMRMTQAELEANPHFREFSQDSLSRPPLRGWLAVPLKGRNGQNIGLIQLSDKYEGDFTESDEDILVQLAQMASVAVENTRLYAAEQLARTQAEATNRIKDEFLAVLSHELRSPLNPILGWSRLMQTRSMDQATIAYGLETIERNAKLQTQLIEDLLDISRILQGKMSLNVAPVDLQTTIEAAIETVSLAAEAKSIQVKFQLLERTVELPPESPQAAIAPDASDSHIRVLGDATRLQQVVWNLLSNAVKFTSIGGQVEIQLERLDSLVQIKIIDTGKGIKPEFLPHLFEYFRQEDSTTTRKYGGLGLGLAIVRHIVELHGGLVSASSPGEGMGATFIVQLPVLQQSVPDARLSSNAATLDSTAAMLAGIRVLVVDDEADSRDLVVFILEQAGAEVIAVSSATEVLRLWSEWVLAAGMNLQPIDLLISDIGMPEVDGYMLLRRLRSQFAGQFQVPAIALTAYAGEFNLQQSLVAGFQQHLTKPIEPAELVAAVAKIVGRH